MSASIDMNDLVMSDFAESSACGDACGPTPIVVEAGEHPAMEILGHIQDAHKEILDRAKAVDVLYKSLRKEMKKVCKKRRRASGAPSNLMRPIELSAELSAFLGKEPGCMMTRGQVTSAINNYATSKSIKKQNNGRVIILDLPLAALLGLVVGTEVQIFHVQTHLKTQNHYVKSDLANPARV